MRLVGALALTTSVLLGGCGIRPEERDTVDQPEHSTGQDDVWVVVDGGDLGSGVQLLQMEHGTIGDSEEFYASDTYALSITDGTRNVYLLWYDSVANPFNLKPGDRFRFTASSDNLYDSNLQGFWASPNDVALITE